MTETYHLSNEKARPSNANQNRNNPVVWGSMKGQRISMTVQNGKVWLHVYRDGQRLSIGIFPDQVLKLIAHSHFLLPIAEDQNRTWREARGPTTAGPGPNLDEAALTG